MGGDPQFGVDDCPGPCDLRAIEGGYSNFDSPENPAAVYRRGQRVRMKYSRNNHGPGGFIRMTLVNPDKMMDKKEHEKNAFYYTCWGANPTAAGADEMGEDQYGFDLIGTDGEQHDQPKGYYTMDVTIPPVVPDGKYVLGWAWFGGTSGSVKSNSPQEPAPYGYFSDYWSCSFVEISGGDDLVKSFTPVFNNDNRFSDEGCMAANDHLGVCVYEPCEATGEYQKPRPFKNGDVPADLTPENFGGSADGAVDPPMTGEETPGPPMEETSPPPMDATPAPETGDRNLDEEVMLIKKRSCRCLAAGDRCWRMLAQLTDDYCVMKTAAEDQPAICRDSCCDYCASGLRRTRWLCEKDEIKAICGM